MAVWIDRRDVMATAAPWLGMSVVTDGDWAEEAARFLTRRAAAVDALAETRDLLEERLLSAISHATRGSMRVRPDGDTEVRLTLRDIRTLTDDLMYLLLRALPVSEADRREVVSFAMRAESLSAWRALLTRYAALSSPEETRAITRLVKDAYPPWRYQNWLKA